jgi:hypothetical protein
MMRCISQSTGPRLCQDNCSKAASTILEAAEMILPPTILQQSTPAQRRSAPMTAKDRHRKRLEA